MRGSAASFSDRFSDRFSNRFSMEFSMGKRKSHSRSVRKPSSPLITGHTCLGTTWSQHFGCVPGRSQLDKETTDHTITCCCGIVYPTVPPIRQPTTTRAATPRDSVGIAVLDHQHQIHTHVIINSDASFSLFIDIDISYHGRSEQIHLKDSYTLSP